MRKELGIDSGLSQRTINRAIALIGSHSDRIIVKLWKGLDSIYHFENTDVNIDGPAAVVNGSNAELGAFGYPRDFRDQSRPQVEFLTAELQQSRIPFFIRAYPGNTSDPEQYRDALPDIFSMIKEGSWIIVDNGGASGDILDSIVSSGNKYLTRVKMNISDEQRMKEGDREYVEDGVCCLRHTFGSSGRTTYLFFSVDTYNAAERSVDRMISAIKSYEDGKFRKSDFVTVKRNILADVEVKVSLQTSFGFSREDRDGIIWEVMGARSGIFKLESSEQLTPSEALNKYRARATVEHLIHSFKRITGLKPLRIWKEDTIRGSMMLALLSETAIAMARCEMKDRIENRRFQNERISCEAFYGIDRLVARSFDSYAHYLSWSEKRGAFQQLGCGFEGDL